MLDISRSPTEQDFESKLGSFDLVVAANVLHATPRLQTTLTHVRQLLKPNGWLLLLEGANPPLWGDMIFTLIDGWWSFEDKELRPDYPLMRRDRWCQVLAESGFPAVACLNDARMGDDSNHTVYLAQAEVTVPERPMGRIGPMGQMRPMVASGSPSGPTTTVGDEHDTELVDLVRLHAARVMRLSREVIDPNQPLSERGLDSLMAVELRTQLSQALGTDVSLNPLRMRRSVAEIAAYLRNPDAPSAFREASGTNLSNLELDVPRVHLVPLQPNGQKTPLFFVPAGYGDLLAFHDVAHAFGTDQPVYGLQPASA